MKCRVRHGHALEGVSAGGDLPVRLSMLSTLHRQMALGKGRTALAYSPAHGHGLSRHQRSIVGPSDSGLGAPDIRYEQEVARLPFGAGLMQ